MEVPTSILGMEIGEGIERKEELEIDQKRIVKDWEEDRRSEDNINKVM